jgi:Vault protein inter-alpha-trypsin domain
MKDWTPQAEQRLEEYLRARVAREGLDGTEAEELKEDFRAHVYEEAEQSPAEVIGLMHLEGILGKLDAGYRPENVLGDGTKKYYSGCGNQLSWVCGVIFPMIVLIFEWCTGWCGSIFFDPIPTIWHGILVAMVPLINGWLLLGARGRYSEKIKGTLAGMGFVIALFYGLLFVPLLPASVFAVLFMGMGLLSLTPILAGISTWRIARARLKHSPTPAEFRVGYRIGIAVALSLLVILEGPSLWTRFNLNRATGEGTSATAAISRLRFYHSERVLLKACYEGNRGTERSTDVSGWIQMGWEIVTAIVNEDQVTSVDSEKCRDVFFRVTGKSFNSIKPPIKQNQLWRRDQGNAIDDFEFDDHRGGDQVAVRLKYLDLAESRFDGHYDSASGLGYGEWTMVFQNDSSQSKEARCQVRLPRGGRVSRLTLWVNGEPREAAFSSVSKVKAAYKEVAIRQSRDPVLVNMVAPDTVMVQCFPVPSGGKMKIRFGITAPLEQGTWELPYIVEQNFGLKDGLEHSLWLQGDHGFSLSDATGEMKSHLDGPAQSLSQSLKSQLLQEPGHVVKMSSADAPAGAVWCEDRFATPAERYLIRETGSIHHDAVREVIVVIDGSASLKERRKEILAALEKCPSDGLKILLADDTARWVNVSDLADYRFSGGRDNEPAMREAIRHAKESNAPIIWIHGPQSVGLSKSEQLMQLLERGSVHPVIHEVEAIAGPNRLGESIFRLGCLKRAPEMSRLSDNLVAFIHVLHTAHDEPFWSWKRAEKEDGLSGKKVWDQLARYWAALAAEDASLLPDEAKRASTAATYQMVTPVSGAVVLETQAQYDQNGLNPVDPSATPQIPSIPEPSSSIMIVIAAAASMLRRKRPEAV